MSTPQTAPATSGGNPPTTWCQVCKGSGWLVFPDPGQCEACGGTGKMTPRRRTAEDYREFNASKECLAKDSGLPCSPDEVNPLLKPFQRDIVAWAVQGGRRALFESFGLGKTMQQLEICRLVLEKQDYTTGPQLHPVTDARQSALIVMPLGVRQEFVRDAAKLGTAVKFIRSLAEVTEARTIYLTNYETVRDGKLDPTLFGCVSLDEAAILRGLGGTKTFREFMRHFEYRDGYRFVATAIPSPNEYLELAAYAAFLDIMDVGQIKTRFFKRNPAKQDDLTLLPHKEAEFWLWVKSWATYVLKPSDIDPEYSDEGYELPPLEVRWHRVDTDHSTALADDHTGQGRLIKNSALGVRQASKEKRESLSSRLAAVEVLLKDAPKDEQFILWPEHNDEQAAIEKMLARLGRSCSSIYGKTKDELRIGLIDKWLNLETQDFVSKLSMYGSGTNLQQSRRMVFPGIGYKAHDFIQGIHRIQRFLQTRDCIVDCFYSEAEEQVREELLRKWKDHIAAVARMTALVRQYGLGNNAAQSMLARTATVEREAADGENWVLARNDAFLEALEVETDTVGLILTSIPFSTQYEYTPSYLDFGHSEDDSQFWQQMDFLIPELYRILKPGRVCLIHVKDRIVPGGLTGLGFQTSSTFHEDAVYAFQRHGFAKLGIVTIETDVVRENKQTNRLGWTEQCKDGSRMGFGQSEYLIAFRKRVSDPTNGYADEPVVKDKHDYSISQWQLDAHGKWRSSGNRYLTSQEYKYADHARLYQLWKRECLESPYDYDRHVEVAEALFREGSRELPDGGRTGGRLPTGFMLLPPFGTDPDIWSDVVRMANMNSSQAQKGREQHVCPFPVDIVKRSIIRFSQPGDIVYDPFSGMGTAPIEAMKLGRIGRGSELSQAYWKDSCGYARDAASKLNIPTLFDVRQLEALEVPA